MFSNYMENMTPFVKLKRPRKKRKGLSWKGSSLSQPIVLLRGCLHSPSHKWTYSSCLPLPEAKWESKTFVQIVFSSIFLSIAWVNGNCLTSRITRTGPGCLFVFNWNLGSQVLEMTYCSPFILPKAQGGSGTWLGHTTTCDGLGF